MRERVRADAAREVNFVVARGLTRGGPGRGSGQEGKDVGEPQEHLYPEIEVIAAFGLCRGRGPPHRATKGHDVVEAGL
jgi:hypothetical protein